ncbi:hypothetical protein J7L85_05225, partial [candidate division WOR-3 bacterium]|nr:hypothetical protein [candidate division WOR-3 bacterium]
QSLHEVLKIVSIDNKFKDEIINKLISQYARLHTYPVKYYLTECLKYLVGSNPDKWWNKISEVLGKYQSIDRESILRYIFEKKKY